MFYRHVREHILFQIKQPSNAGHVKAYLSLRLYACQSNPKSLFKASNLFHFVLRYYRANMLMACLNTVPACILKTLVGMKLLLLC